MWQLPSRAVIMLLLLPLPYLTFASLHHEQSIDHSILQSEAVGEAKELFRVDTPSMAGCSHCSSEEMDYCISVALMHDHCCCDHNMPERFRYIAHTCYKSDIPSCKPVAADCEEFQRLDTCCCQPYLRSQSQFFAWNSSNSIRANLLLCLILTILITR